jgi:hypothetical protein
MVAESVAHARAPAARPTRNGKRAPKPIDRRFVLGKRIAQLSAIFAERAGLDANDPDPVLSAAVEKAARLTGLAEDAAARAARNDPRITLDDLVRLQRLADLCVRRLRLDRQSSSAPSLTSYLAARGTP